MFTSFFPHFRAFSSVFATCQGRSALDVAREANHTDLLVAFQEKAGLFFCSGNYGDILDNYGE